MSLLGHFYRFEAEKSDCGATGGPGGGFRERNTCWQLTGRHKERLAELTRQREEKERERIAKEKADAKAEAQKKRKKDAQFRVTRLYRDISETLGTDDVDVIRDFRGLMEDLHKQKAEAVQEYNAAFDELIDQFVRADAAGGRRGRGAFVSGLQRAHDPTRIPGFDEVVQYVRDNPRVRQVISGSDGGESTGYGDIEAAVFHGLRQGKKQAPALNSDEVWDEALQYLDSIDTKEEAEKFDEYSEAVPFSLEKSDMTSLLSIAYRMANAPAGGITIAGKEFKGGQFIPKETMEKASEEEKRALADGGKPQPATKTDTPEFKSWFGESEVVDDDGNPLVVYHGTDHIFTKFDVAKGGTNFSDDASKAGFFFAAAQDDAGEFGKHIMPVYLHAKNVRQVDEDTQSEFTKEWLRDLEETDPDEFDYQIETREYENTKGVNKGLELAIVDAKSRGYDAVKITGSGEADWYIVFDAKQIKSATHNSGAFDPNTSDITK